MPEWKPIFFLPNVELKKEIEFDVIALVPASDQRIVLLRNQVPIFADFLDRFTDNFGKRFKPVTLLVRADASPRVYDVGAVASFRDIVALSVILYSRAVVQQSPHQVVSGACFGEIFSFYPWTLNERNDCIVGQTPALFGGGHVQFFRGQSSPYVPRAVIGASDIDQPLLAALLEVWRAHFESPNLEWKNTALIRSLNMAYHASLLPSGPEVRIFDIGRIISLWISAFEILVHPGDDGRSDYEKVFELIDSTTWIHAEFSEVKRSEVIKKKTRSLSLGSYLYYQLYKCRNDFLHGNPIKFSDMVLENQIGLFDYVAPLYRIALSTFLAIEFDHSMPESNDFISFVNYITKSIAFDHYQDAAESALLAAAIASEP